MTDRLYEYMDWPRIEAVVYGEENLPREILGPQAVKGSVLIQCFFPHAESVKVHTKKDGKNYAMELVDETGYYAALLPGKEIPSYEFIVEDMDGKKQRFGDPYRFPSQFTLEEEEMFRQGIYYKAYQKLGAHPMTIDRVKGVYFAVWAPNALRVSVVGDFNQWDGRVHPMQKSPSTGIHELFIPRLKQGDLYKFEIKMVGGASFLKTDPYANSREIAPATAGIVEKVAGYRWGDAAWLKKRKAMVSKSYALSIGQIDLEALGKNEEGDYVSYRELALRTVEYALSAGYTHVELPPLMEYGKEAGPYATSGYYAPTSRYGSPRDFQYFVDYLHQKEIGVLMDWTPAHFPREEEGMSMLDGTCLYERCQSGEGIHPLWGTLLFDYASPHVKNFLISNVLYWLECYHLDGLRLDDVDAMLYLDYGRTPGSWTPNIFGGNENLEAVEFLKHLSSRVRKTHPDTLLIAQEDGYWRDLTGPVDEAHVGFHYKWNNGWTKSFLDYIHGDRSFRTAHHDELTVSMLYAYSEAFILTLNDRDISSLEQFLESLPGDETVRQDNFKVALGYFMTHPGKKYLAFGQNLSEELKVYLRELNQLYKDHPALWEADAEPAGFEWIQFMEPGENILAYIRKDSHKKDLLLVLCNFSGQEQDAYKVGVPYYGKYKEIFNSDGTAFGGNGVGNPRVKTCRKEEWDGRPYRLTVKLPPLGLAVFAYQPV
ncbi:MAG: 1,4-alpha-glucan branching protein GlgB [Lachnospiraceae bacterium]|nr:1,4-alpha-glucan branching protein GlgB [Lachnospiraceae bacterium]